MRRTPHLLLAGALALALPLAACGDDDTAADPPATDDGGSTPTGDGLTVKAKDNLSFDKAEYSVEAGELAVTYENEGSIAHTLLIKDVDGFKLAVGDTDEGTVDLEPGTYELYCDVAGHSSMKAELTVE